MHYLIIRTKLEAISQTLSDVRAIGGTLFDIEPDGSRAIALVEVEIRKIPYPSALLEKLLTSNSGDILLNAHAEQAKKVFEDQQARLEAQKAARSLKRGKGRK
ncbi:MAG: hypothetical protein V3V47_01905 [Desulfobacteria bacterium]